MRLLDLFCCQGGAATGYARAGFAVVGVDLEPQPNYPPLFRFVQADALEILANYEHGDRPLGQFDVIHASPPCQGYSTMSNRHGSNVPRLIDRVRWYLERIGLPWVIENVTGARREMRSPMSLHGGQFGLPVYRPRLFESNMLLTPPPKASRPKDPVAVYGRQESRGRLLWTRNDGTELRAATLDEARTAMEMPWADWRGVREAIPPAYTEWIGRQLAAHLEVAA